MLKNYISECPTKAEWSLGNVNVFNMSSEAPATHDMWNGWINGGVNPGVGIRSAPWAEDTVLSYDMTFYVHRNATPQFQIRTWRIVSDDDFESGDPVPTNGTGCIITADVVEAGLGSTGDEVLYRLRGSVTLPTYRLTGENDKLYVGLGCYAQNGTGNAGGSVRLHTREQKLIQPGK